MARRQPVDLDAARAALDAAPADPIVVDAVRALAASGAWREALDRSRAAIRAQAERDPVLRALAQGALDSGRADRCLKALEQLTHDGSEASETTGLRAAAHLAAGRADRARQVVEARLVDDPEDPWAAEWLKEHGPEPVVRSAVQPMISLDTVRRVAAAGHPSRALRLARRLAIEHPSDELEDLRVQLADAVADLDAEARGVLDGMPLPELPMELL